MKALSITTAGAHMTLASTEELKAAVQTAGWKTGAIMHPCSRIDISEPISGSAMVVRFPDAEHGDFLSALTRALCATGPVNLGLTDENGDGLRVVFYFPDARTAQKRMDAAVKVVGA